MSYSPHLKVDQRLTNVLRVDNNRQFFRGIYGECRFLLHRLALAWPAGKCVLSFVTILLKILQVPLSVYDFYRASRAIKKMVYGFWRFLGCRRCLLFARI